MSPAFEVLNPTRRTLPVVVSVPHAGRVYPPDLLASTRLDLRSLRRSEDPDVDALFAGATALGAPLIVARTARLYVDLNRSPDEIDAEMFGGTVDLPVDAASPRLASGLGLFPRYGSNGVEIYEGKLDAEDARRRIETVHHPFHGALATLLRETRERYGFALLVDGHSMPSNAGPGEADQGRRRVDIVLGDRHGRSAAMSIPVAAARTLTGLGYSVARNEPYAGAYIAERHGAPDAGVHVLQVEINRALYMDERRFERRASFATVARDMSRLIASLGALDLTTFHREAAE